VANFLARIILGVKIKDPMSGYFMLKKELFKSCKDKLDPKGYKILLEIYYLSKPEKFIEVPYVFKDRKAGHSKLTGSVIKDYIVSLFQLRKQ
jgi:dolichol-phosphate mannosyltransferase